MECEWVTNPGEPECPVCGRDRTGVTLWLYCCRKQLKFTTLLLPVIQWIEQLKILNIKPYARSGLFQLNRRSKITDCQKHIGWWKMPVAYWPAGGMYYCHPSTNHQMWWKIWSSPAVPYTAFFKWNLMLFMMDQKQTSQTSPGVRVFLCGRLFCPGLIIPLSH